MAYLPTSCGREDASRSSMMDPFSIHVLSSNKLCRDSVATWGLLHRSPPCSTFSSNLIHLGRCDEWRQLKDMQPSLKVTPIPAHAPDQHLHHVPSRAVLIVFIVSSTLSSSGRHHPKSTPSLKKNWTKRIQSTPDPRETMKSLGMVIYVIFRWEKYMSQNFPCRSIL